MDELLSIGEFANRCGLSVKVLRSYAEAGLLAPAMVDPTSGYRYYDPAQLAQAELVVLLRRAGVAVADIGPFLANPSGHDLEGWERSLVAEVGARRQALADVRCRLGLDSARTRGSTVIDIIPVRDGAELAAVFDLCGAQLAEPIDHADRHFDDLEASLEADRALMLVARSGRRAVGAALAFRSDEASAALRVIGVEQAFRHRGIGRRLVERVEAQARLLGLERIGVGTDEALGFWRHLGYVPHLLLQWVFDPALYEESAAVLAGPLAGTKHWQSSFNDVPQLFVELDEPRLDLRGELGSALGGCHVGFVMFKTLAIPVPGR